MSDGRVFSTSDPVTVAAFLSACDEERAFAARVVESAAAIGKNKGALRGSGVFGQPPETTGLAADDPNDPPEGWVYSKGREHLIPRRGKAGDPAREWLAASQPRVSARVVLAEHGLPFNDLFGAKADLGALTTRFNVPVVFHHDGTVWAHYRGTPGLWAGGPSEPTWDERRLSEYHAAREARDAAEETVEAGRA